MINTHTITSVALLMVCFSMVACSRGPRNFANTNDTLRAENLELSRTIEELEQALQRRDQQLDAMRQRVDGATPLAGVDAPTLAELKLDRYTGPIDADGDGKDDLVRVYLQTRDQRGRTLPVEGTAVATLVLIADEAKPQVLSKVALDAEALRAAYRDGMTGVHYTIDLPLDDNTPAGESAVGLKVAVTDAATGATHTVAGAYRVTR